LTLTRRPDKLQHFVRNLLSVTLAAGLFALAFPNVIVAKGLWPALWVAYIPLLLLVNKGSPATLGLWGLFYGALSTALFNYWLAAFHPAALVAAVTLFALYYGVFFLALRRVVTLLPERGYLVETALWVGFEYLRTLGFTGFPYGITGYSQWTLTPLIKIADVGGVWAVSALVIFPQCWLAAALARKQFKQRALLPASMWAVALITCIGYGLLSKPTNPDTKMATIGLVQVNSNPWKSGIAEYQAELTTLKRLSDTALNTAKCDLVVWPETAFVPSFDFHNRYRDDADAAALVRNAQAYLASKQTPFIIGNDEARYLTTLSGDGRLARYNAALLWRDGSFVERYYKTRLVPFSEYFPYEKTFPALYRFLSSQVTHFWDAGKRFTVFTA
jgi:apolipoprotein N-acyltransferase